MKEWIKSIIILPFNVTVVIPFLILYLTKFDFILPTFVQIFVGAVFIIAGLSLAVWSMVLFDKIGKGTLAPWSATNHLVVDGPYRFIRHPMISGILFILFGESLILDSTYLFCWWFLFFIINLIYFKIFEESDLERKFGDEYIEYKKNVPMFFPKIKFKR